MAAKRPLSWIRANAGRSDRHGAGHIVLLAFAAAACFVAPATMLAGVHSPLRTAAALILLCLAPGTAALPLLDRRPLHFELALVVGASLALCALLAQTMLWLDAWEPVVATCGLAAVCLASIGAQLAGWGAGGDAEAAG